MTVRALSPVFPARYFEPEAAHAVGAVEPIYYRELSVFLHTVSGYFLVEIEAERRQSRCHSI